MKNLVTKKRTCWGFKWNEVKKIIFYFVGYLTKIKENVKDEQVKTL